MPNLAQSQMTLNFEGKYLQNSVFKIEQVHDRQRFLTHSGKKFGEFWSTNYGDLNVESHPLKLTFLEDHILVARGCCAPKCLLVLENDQVLLAHLLLGTGVYLLFNGVSKIGLKFSKCAPITLGVVGVALKKFATRRAPGWG